MAVTRASWAHSLLSALDVPITSQNLAIIVGWATAEGGAGPQFGVPANIASYNPLNTTQTEPGSVGTPGNVPPVQAYANWAQGLQATVTTLNNGNYPDILDMLQSGTASAAVAARTIDGSKWGTRDLTAALISGADISTATTGDAVQSITGGGVYGLGGTGTTANAPAASLWIVGSSSNPDQDCWTTANQYAQNAQWYWFTDGETVFAADGYLLMAQTPAAIIVLWDPGVLAANDTYDNTSWNYTTTHTAKGSTVRRASLTKIVSPTEIELKLICDIDEFRGGDTVYLKNFGVADGIWLVSEAVRSYFAPYATLTLVQAMQPLNANSGLALGPAYLGGPAASKPGSGTVVRAMIREAADINAKAYPYVWGGGHARAGFPDRGVVGQGPGANGTNIGFDCSGAVGAVLAAAGLLPWGQPVPGDQGLIQALHAEGRARERPGVREPGGHPVRRSGRSHLHADQRRVLGYRRRRAATQRESRRRMGRVRVRRRMGARRQPPTRVQRLPHPPERPRAASRRRQHNEHLTYAVRIRAHRSVPGSPRTDPLVRPDLPASAGAVKHQRPAVRDLPAVARLELLRDRRRELG